MGDPKLHHYVPQFHLRRFANDAGRVWIWNKSNDKTFQTSPVNIAAERQFYRLTDLEEAGHDPLAMEKQLSELEGQVSQITAQWLSWLRDTPPQTKIEIPRQNREIFALFLSIQYLRTLDMREILAALADLRGGGPASNDPRQLHTALMWDDETVESLTSHFIDSTWIFALNTSDTSFVTSDNPVAFRTSNNRQWVKAGILASEGIYAVYPMAPDIILYCYPSFAPYENLRRFGDCLSPIAFSTEMARNENTGQVFSATRFLVAKANNFDSERDFAQSIGTDRFKISEDP